MKQVDYDRVSAGYDRRYRLGGPAGIAASLHKLVRKVGARRVLEVGCGTGHWLTQIKGPTIRCGLDYSAGMLDKARQRDRSLDLVRGTASHLPFDGDAFDLVFCVHALHHFDDPPAFIGEAKRVLDHCGALAVIGMDPQTEQDRWYLYDYFPGTRELDVARYPPGEAILRWIAQAGFTGCERSLAARIVHDFMGPEVLGDPILHKDGTSQLSLLTEQAFQQGMARIKDSLQLAEREGRTAVFPTDIALPMVVGFVSKGMYGAK
jgi:ubiquinone/menaquinone biosynthesis C-methylase UbiE